MPAGFATAENDSEFLNERFHTAVVNHDQRFKREDVFNFFAVIGVNVVFTDEAERFLVNRAERGHLIRQVVIHYGEMHLLFFYVYIDDIVARMTVNKGVALLKQSLLPAEVAFFLGFDMWIEHKYV